MLTGKLACLQIFTQAATGAELYLALPLTDIRNSLVVVTVNAASLTLVTNESPARITSAEAGALLLFSVPLSAETSCLLHACACLARSRSFRSHF